MSTQIPFGASSEFAVNPESRCPCILLLDTSGSMQGKPITELQAGLMTYRDELMADTLAAKRVEVAVVTFGGVVCTASDFVTADNFVPPELTASGDTPLGLAVMHALDMLQKRKVQYRENGVSFYRPWIFLITDGSPTDAWDEASEKIKDGEAKKAFSFFCVGVENANLEILGKIAVREPMKLQGLKFRDLFKWLSNSQQAVSRSTPGESVPLPPPRGWAEV